MIVRIKKDINSGVEETRFATEREAKDSVFKTWAENAWRQFPLIEFEYEDGRKETYKYGQYR